MKNEDQTPRDYDPLADNTVLTPGKSTPSSSGTINLAAADDAHRLCLLVISDRLVATFPLPNSGEISIGRGPKCGVLIDDPSISRKHAVLAMGPPVTIRDVGSANGTRVGGQLLEPDRPHEVTPGEVLQVGSATLIVQRRSVAIRPRRLWAHDYFEVRLEEECARAARSSSQFALARVHCDQGGGLTALQEVVVDILRLSDVVGEYGPGEYELLFPDTTPEQAETVTERLVGELERRGVQIQVGVACWPRDARNADELMARAGMRALGRVARSSDPSPIVATMQELYRLAERIAPGNITVLILGETGVGKEVLAERIHRASTRAAKPYLKLNCAAFTETLLESELFGHERGAFTGAVQAKPGLLESAQGGSVFLDEVGELPLSIQVKLLRVLEERQVRRVGSLKSQPIDVRFIAATNRDLEAEVARGTFRQDLFFRLNGATLVIPPLRERTGEIPALTDAFLIDAARQAGVEPAPAISPEAMTCLIGYSWPGNIRELRNVVERAVLLAGHGPIQPAHLPLEKMRVTFTSPRAFRDPGASAPPEETPAAAGSTPGSRADAEELQRILTALQTCGGNQTRAAEMLGIARRTLINKLERYGVTRPRKGR